LRASAAYLQEALRKRSVPFSAGRGISPLGNRIRQQYWRRFTILASISRSSSIRRGHGVPSGINKASGLKAALNELSLSFHNVVELATPKMTTHF